MACHDIMLPSIVGLMKVHNSQRLTQVFSYCSSEAFLIPFLNDSRFATDRRHAAQALQNMLNPSETADNAQLRAVRRRNLEAHEALVRAPRLVEFLKNKDGLKYSKTSCRREATHRVFQLPLGVQATTACWCRPMRSPPPPLTEMVALTQAALAALAAMALAAMALAAAR